MHQDHAPFFRDLEANVRQALAEDIGAGDITARLIPPHERAQARVICREQAVICGRPWVEEVFRQVEPAIETHWRCAEGEGVPPDTIVFTAQGPARALLTAERCALNFLQTLSGTATTARRYAELVKDTGVALLDTRKTLPGLRLAQKYAVLLGGCANHRLGLYDAYLIKENHIAACGGVTQAVARARALEKDKPVEVEVESLEQLEEALAAAADIVMLDNFSLEDIREAVRHCGGRAKLEASGGYTEDALLELARTGVDYISIGSLTKHVRAVDFSMRLA